MYFSKNLLPHLTIVFAVGQKKEWSNGIFENDPMSTKMMIRTKNTDDNHNPLRKRTTLKYLQKIECQNEKYKRQLLKLITQFQR